MKPRARADARKAGETAHLLIYDLPMLSLHPMTPESFQRFLERSVTTYAAENVRSGRWTAEEAHERSAVEFQMLLPEGSATPDNFCFDLHDADRN